MKKKIAVIAVICVIIAILTIPGFAFEDSEKATFWGNGLNMPLTIGNGGIYGGILASLSGSPPVQTVSGRITDIVSYEQYGGNTTATINSIAYTITVGAGASTNDLYFLYRSDRELYLDYDIVAGNENFTKITLTKETLPDGDFEAYYKSSSTGEMSSYSVSIQSVPGGYTCVRLHSDNMPRYEQTSQNPTFTIKVMLHFGSMDIQNYIKPYDNIWNGIDSVINTNDLNTIGGYIGQIVRADLIYKLFLVSIILLLIGISYNWLVSL